MLKMHPNVIYCLNGMTSHTPPAYKSAHLPFPVTLMSDEEMEFEFVI